MTHRLHLLKLWVLQLTIQDGRFKINNPISPHKKLNCGRCYGINAASLAFGIVGNLFLLLNFTQRIRYVIALPISTTLWFIASVFVRSLTILPFVKLTCE
jgi:hypothetical protein